MYSDANGKVTVEEEADRRLKFNITGFPNSGTDPMWITNSVNTGIVTLMQGNPGRLHLSHPF